MRKFLAFLAVLTAFGLPTIIAAQSFGGYGTPTVVAANYGAYSERVFTGSTGATGSYTVAMNRGYVVTKIGGVAFNPYSTSTPITVGVGAVQETVTPSAVSGCGTGVNVAGQCLVTATFTFAHGVGTPVTSGDNGIAEAIADVGLHGGGMVYWSIDPGSVTLSTVAANTNVGTITIPTRSVVSSATAIVKTTIGTCAGGWSLGWTSGTEFTAANTTLAAGTTTDSSTVTLPAVVAAATIPVIHCTTSVASAGVVHAHFEGWKLVAPTN